MAIWKQPTTYILCVLLGVGAFLRFDRISEQSLWVDEYWALYLATGRGNEIFDIPANTIVRSPPAANFVGAPHIWHIWTGLASTPHPPLYHLMLRAWVDIFGDSDTATRGMSAVFGLGGILLIFDLARALYGKLAGVFAAAMMTFAPIQIDFAQQDRPYTLLAFIGLVMWRVLVLIEQKGVSRLRLAMLGLGAAVLALTHYFSAGVIAAAIVYAGIRLRGRDRRNVIVTILGSVALVAALWGPEAWMNRHRYIVGPNFGNMGLNLAQAAIDVPRKLIFGELGDPKGKILAAWAMAFLVYLSPIIRISKDRKILLGWLWVIGGLGVVLAVDLRGGTQFVALPRYIFLFAPGVYLILAAPWGTRLGRLLPPALVLGTVLFGIDRWQAGPQISESTRALAQLIDQKVDTQDAVIITGTWDTEPAFRYFSISHYTGDWRNPVMFVTRPPDDRSLSELSQFRHVWVVGHDASEMHTLLPGWRTTEFHGIRPGLTFWGIEPAS